MFRMQSDLLQGLPWEVFQALTGCGPIYRDVLQGPFEIVGAPLENADPSHAIFQVKNQGNLNIPVASFGGNVNITGNVNISTGNITIDGQSSGVTTTVTLNHITCEEDVLKKTPYTFTFTKGLLTAVVVGEKTTLDCQSPPEPAPTYFQLTRCDDPESVILVDGADLTNPELGSVHKDDNGDCWEVTAVDAEGEPTAFAEAESFPPGEDPCGDCAAPPETFYELTLCGDTTTIVVSAADLTDPAMGSVHQRDDATCWEVTGVDVAGEPTAFVEAANFPPGDDPCGDCQAPPEGFCCQTEFQGGTGVLPANGLIGNEMVSGDE